MLTAFLNRTPCLCVYVFSDSSDEITVCHREKGNKKKRKNRIPTFRAIRKLHHSDE